MPIIDCIEIIHLIFLEHAKFPYPLEYITLNYSSLEFLFINLIMLYDFFSLMIWLSSADIHP